MGEGHVRAILVRHATHAPGRAPSPGSPRGRQGHDEPGRDPAVPAAGSDPNLLVPAGELAGLLATQPPGAQAAVAQAYVALWARTFRTLVAQLRGRPERALALFADEVYPFLRGDRAAARIESATHRQAVLRLAPGLPVPYAAALARGFTALSGAHVAVTPRADGALDVTYRAAAGDRLARIAQHAAGLRLHLVAASVLAGVLGIALAGPAGVPPQRVGVLLAGLAAAQLAGNAVHALRHGHPAGPLAPLRPGRRALLAQLAVAGGAAVAAAAWLAPAAPLVAAFAAAGIAAALLYGPLRDAGAGPVALAALYGPLIVLGAATASGAHIGLQDLAWSFVPGFLAAAFLYVDDLADAPLDEAGGKRTLAVRLPRRGQSLVYSALVGAGFLPLTFLLLLVPAPPAWVPVALLALACLGLVLMVRVRTSLAEPSRLAAARLGSQALHAGTTLTTAALAAGVA